MLRLIRPRLRPEKRQGRKLMPKGVRILRSGKKIKKQSRRLTKLPRRKDKGFTRNLRIPTWLALQLLLASTSKKWLQRSASILLPSENCKYVRNSVKKKPVLQRGSKSLSVSPCKSKDSLRLQPRLLMMPQKSEQLKSAQKLRRRLNVLSELPRKQNLQLPKQRKQRKLPLQRRMQKLMLNAWLKKRKRKLLSN